MPDACPYECPGVALGLFIAQMIGRLLVNHSSFAYLRAVTTFSSGLSSRDNPQFSVLTACGLRSRERPLKGSAPRKTARRQRFDFGREYGIKHLLLRHAPIETL
jgi:hypothetical protein